MADDGGTPAAAQAPPPATFVGLWDVEDIVLYQHGQSLFSQGNALLEELRDETRDPAYDPTLDLRVHLGSFRTRGASLTAGGALVPDLVAWRFWIDEQRSDGPVRNRLLGEEAAADRARRAQLKLRIEPRPGFSVDLVHAQLRERLGSPAVDAVSRDPSRRQIFTNVATRERYDENVTELEIAFALAANAQLRSTTSYERSRFDFVADIDQAPTRFADRNVGSEARNEWSQELAFELAQGAWSGRVGAGLRRLRRGAGDAFEVAAADELPELEDPILAAYPDGLRAAQRVPSDRRLREISAFGSTRWEPSDRWTLELELRYVDTRRVDQSRRSLVNETPFNGVDPELDALLASFIERDAPIEREARTRAWLPAARLVFRPTPILELELGAERSHRPAGSSVNDITFDLVEFDPEFSWTYGAAARASLLGARLELLAGARATFWRDQQVSVSRLFEASLGDVRFGSQFENAGRGRRFDLELGARFAVSDRLEVFANTVVSRSRYGEFRNAFGNLEGEPFDHVPRLLMVGGFRYQLRPDWAFTLHTAYQSSSVLQYDIDDAGRITGDVDNDPFVLVHLALERRIGRNLVASFQLRNVLDQEYVAESRSPSDPLPVVVPGAPRSLNFSLQYSF